MTKTHDNPPYFAKPQHHAGIVQVKGQPGWSPRARAGCARRDLGMTVHRCAGVGTRRAHTTVTGRRDVPASVPGRPRVARTSDPLEAWFSLCLKGGGGVRASVPRLPGVPRRLADEGRSLPGTAGNCGSKGGASLK